MKNRPTMFESAVSEPLASRMRPRTLDEYIGQDHIVGKGRLLRRAIQADQLSSLIFYGPPGTGKTTLARVIANTTAAEFLAMNAVLDGVKQIREAIQKAQDARRFGKQTILFIDEVHRFNKAQQDALLPWVENGTVILIGATTENPFFEVNKALVSRSRIFQLNPLLKNDVEGIINQALHDPQRGYGKKRIHIDSAAMQHLVDVANGDARAALNALELAVETTQPEDGQIVIDLAIAEESIQQRAVLYDKEGDSHFDVISAFIKSIRGSDPDAAMYWLAKMLYAGEDPRFIFRRLLILASEDIGLADPHALGIVTAAAQAFDYVGMPEGRYHLAQATLYLSTSEKSNSTLGFFDALRVIQSEQSGDIPTHLKDGSRDGDSFGHGKGYKYPHAYENHWVAQQYLPSALQGRQFYQPSSSGYEKTIQDRVLRQREAQLSAMLETEDSPGDVLTFSPLSKDDHWLERTVSDAGDALSQLRDAAFNAISITRHDRVLDFASQTGLFTFEAIRRVPEGQVVSVTSSLRIAEVIQQAAQANLGQLRQPIIITQPVQQALEAINQNNVPQLEVGWKADVVMGRNILSKAEQEFWESLRGVLSMNGKVSFSEIRRDRQPRLYELVDWTDSDLRQIAKTGEEQLYETADSRFQWRPDRAIADAHHAGIILEEHKELTLHTQRSISVSEIAGWFTPASPLRKSFQAVGSEGEISAIQATYESQLSGRTFPWPQRVSLLVGQRAIVK